MPGVMLYLLPLGVGVTKGNSSRGWGSPFNSFWCCYGTGIESFSKLADSIYFTDAATGALIIARYVDSKLTPSEGGFAVHQTASVAHTGKATIVIDSVGSSTGAATAALKLLIPSWSASPSVKVNGVALPAPAPVPGSFLTLERAWSPGDSVELTLPSEIALSKLDDGREAYRSMYSFVYGETLLVGLAPTHEGNTVPIPVGASPEEWVKTAVKRVGGEGTLRFVVAGTDAKPVTLMPLNEVVDEVYSVYYNLTNTRSGR
eukprot:2450507-Prymnesium_polylepis.1